MAIPKPKFSSTPPSPPIQLPSPFRDKTPETSSAGLNRKDSKSALTTCHGLTSSGRPCRRSLAANDAAAVTSNFSIKKQIVVPNPAQDPAIIFCWQHKDQADRGWNNGTDKLSKFPLVGRTSLDAVFEKLGLDDHKKKKVSSKTEEKSQPEVKIKLIQPKRKKTRRTLCCFTFTDTDKAFLAPKPHTGNRSSTSPSRSGNYASMPTTIPQSTSPSPSSPKASSFSTRESKDSLASKSSPKKSPASIKVSKDKTAFLVPPPPPQPPMSRNPISQPDFRKSLTDKKPSNNRTKSAPSPTAQSPDWIPPMPVNSTDVTKLIYARLLTAMSEPPTKSDDQGYIYMFWQSEVQQTLDEKNAAASLVGGQSSHSVADSEQILQQRFLKNKSAVSSSSAGQPSNPIFLKIGRAANVHQRMSQWQKQCHYNISLLRYYPMQEKTKIPYAGKVEKLIHIHLEMLGMRVKRQCRCGTEHKEWFEIPATASAFKRMDTIIRQWTNWSLQKYS